MATVTIDILCGQSETEAPSRKAWDQFNEWFSRCHNTLHFVAGLILGGSENAECAVQNCRIRACRNPQRFESEGSFRSRVLRLLISEALSIRYEGFAEESEKQETVHGEEVRES
jgi:DNA-directed RNA polymerase specialized sigma24 family protein